jgi:hypothetical protein
LKQDNSTVLACVGGRTALEHFCAYTFGRNYSEDADHYYAVVSSSLSTSSRAVLHSRRVPDELCRKSWMTPTAPSKKRNLARCGCSANTSPARRATKTTGSTLHSAVH